MYSDKFGFALLFRGRVNDVAGASGSNHIMPILILHTYNQKKSHRYYRHIRCGNNDQQGERDYIWDDSIGNPFHLPMFVK